MKKIISIITAAAVITLAAIPVGASHMSSTQTGYGSEWKDYESTTTACFKDTKGHWAEENINRAYDKGWISGYPDGNFNPDSSINRGEAVTVFTRFMGIQQNKPENNYYNYSKPADNAWMIPYMEPAKKLLPQYINGPGAAALEDMPITREDTVYALVLALRYDDKVSYADQSVLNMFKDKNSISAGLKPYVAVAVSNGLVSGYEDGTFGGTDPLTRAEFATLLSKGSTVGFGTGKGMESISDLDADSTPISTPTPTPTDPIVNKATINGMVVNESGIGMSGAKVSLLTGETATTDQNGQYTLETDKTSVTISASMSGYVSAQTTMTVILDSVNYAENLKLVEEADDGTISGMVYDAVVQDGIIAGADISFRAGGNVTTGTVVAEAVSGDDGSYSVTLPTGTYTAETKKSGYSTAYVTVVSQSTDSQQDITLAPEMEGTAFVLTWGDEPTDLDSHLTGPTGLGSRFHVFYSDKTAYDGESECANLDRDDTDSYGPETVTLVNQISGTYRYTIHDYTNRVSTDSKNMSLSGAKVVVYVDGQYKSTFNVPVNQGGTIWTVFEMNDSTITPINTMDYEEAPGAVGASSTGSDYDVDLISSTVTEK